MTINNVARTAYQHDYIVARFVDGEWWYWGAYDDRDKAIEVSSEIGGSVFDTETI